MRIRSGLLSLLWACLLAGLLSTGVRAQTASAPAWQQAITGFLQKHPSLQGRQYTVKWPAATVNWGSCSVPLEVRLQGREQAWGQLYLTLQCPVERRWMRQVSIYVQVNARYLVAQRDLRAGDTLGPNDWKWAEGDLSRQSPLLVTDPQHVEGRLLTQPLPAGSALKLNNFKSITVIRQGDQVQVSLIGRDFSVSTTAQALSDAVAGGTVRVKTPEGKVLQGIAVSQGRVELALE